MTRDPLVLPIEQSVNPVPYFYSTVVLFGGFGNTYSGQILIVYLNLVENSIEMNVLHVFARNSTVLK